MGEAFLLRQKFIFSAVCEKVERFCPLKNFREFSFKLKVFFTAEIDFFFFFLVVIQKKRNMVAQQRREKRSRGKQFDTAHLELSSGHMISSTSVLPMGRIQWWFRLKCLRKTSNKCLREFLEHLSFSVTVCCFFFSFCKIEDTSNRAEISFKRVLFIKYMVFS